MMRDTQNDRKCIQIHTQTQMSLRFYYNFFYACLTTLTFLQMHDIEVHLQQKKKHNAKL